jgi:hypothetical protein
LPTTRAKWGASTSGERPGRRTLPATFRATELTKPSGGPQTTVIDANRDVESTDAALLGRLEASS